MFIPNQGFNIEPHLNDHIRSEHRLQLFCVILAGNNPNEWLLKTLMMAISEAKISSPTGHIDMAPLRSKISAHRRWPSNTGAIIKQQIPDGIEKNDNITTNINQSY